MMLLPVWMAVFLLYSIEKGSGQDSIPCSNVGDCGSTFFTNSIRDCCILPDSRTYSTSFDAEGCHTCYVYGWVYNVSVDLTSAEPQLEEITATEGDEITLTLFYTKYNPRSTNGFFFDIQINGSAKVNEDYKINPTNPVALISNPVPVIVTLLNDRVTGEGLEDIILTLVQDDTRTPSNQNQFLIYDTVRISLLDNEECPSLDDIPDGFVMLDDLKINSTAVYNCTDGFILVGESTRLCTDDLTWSGEIPTCLVNEMVVCSKSSGCANGYLSDSSQSCCMTEEAQSYMNATHPGICNFCLDYKERTKDSSFNSVILIVVILSLLLLLLVTVVSVITIVLYRQKKRGEYSLGKAAQKDAGEEQTE